MLKGYSGYSWSLRGSYKVSGTEHGSANVLAAVLLFQATSQIPTKLFNSLSLINLTPLLQYSANSLGAGLVVHL